jgi:hypothetical protein
VNHSGGRHGDDEVKNGECRNGDERRRAPLRPRIAPRRWTWSWRADRIDANGALLAVRPEFHLERHALPDLRPTRAARKRFHVDEHFLAACAGSMKPKPRWSFHDLMVPSKAMRWLVV